MISIAYYEKLCELFPSLTLWIVGANTQQILFGPNEPKFPPAAAASAAKITQGNSSFFVSIHLENYKIIVADTHQSDYSEAVKIYDWIDLATSFCLDDYKNEASFLEYEKSFSFLARYLFNRFPSDDQDYMDLLASKLNVNFDVKRIVCLFDIPQQNVSEISRFMMRSLKAQVLVNADDILCTLTDEQPILCQTIDRCSDWRHNIKAIILPLLSEIQPKFKVKVNCGISMPVIKPSDYPDAYFEAKNVLKFMKLWPNNSPIGFLEDYSLPYEIMLIPEEDLLHFFQKYYDIFETHPRLLDTVGALVRCSMDIKSTAVSLGVHRNTVVSRIAELRSLLGFDFLHLDGNRARLAMIYYSYTLRYTAFSADQCNK